MSGLQKAIQAAGTQAELAKRIGVKQQHVSYWLKNKVPAEWCRPIFEATGIPAHELRPDIFEQSAA